MFSDYLIVKIDFYNRAYKSITIKFVCINFLVTKWAKIGTLFDN